MKVPLDDLSMSKNSQKLLQLRSQTDRLILNILSKEQFTVMNVLGDFLQEENLL